MEFGNEKGCLKKKLSTYMYYKRLHNIGNKCYEERKALSKLPCRTYGYTERRTK